MKALFNLLDAGVGGGQHVALDIAGELVRQGHGVGVVVPAEGPTTTRFAELGGGVHTANLVSLRRPGVLRGALIARAYDVVYSHTSVPGEILGGTAAALACRPHVVHRHVYPHFSPRTRVRSLQLVLYRAVDRRARTIAVAQHVADAMVDAGIPRERIEVIPNGVPIPTEAAPAPTGNGILRIGLLGRLDPQKGADVFLDAAALVGGGAEFALGAPEVHDRYGEDILAAARAANVDTVIPAGRDFLRSVDVVAIPSRYEGHPLTLLEAMSLGKPIVASAIPGIREVLEPEGAGLLVPPEDTEALAAALRRLIDEDDLRTRLGKRAREVAASQYTLAHMHDRVIRFLEDAASGRAPS
jgi:glycosyltransferase involved in cell wall biosynthesis